MSELCTGANIVENKITLIAEVEKLREENAAHVKRWDELGEWIDNHRYGPIRQNKQKLLDKMKEVQNG